MDARTRENGYQGWPTVKELRHAPMDVFVTKDAGKMANLFGLMVSFLSNVIRRCGWWSLSRKRENGADNKMTPRLLTGGVYPDGCQLLVTIESDMTAISQVCGSLYY
jgi:hypothetical protein